MDCRLFLCAPLPALAAFASPSAAAENGALGSTSSGRVAIQASVAAGGSLARMSGKGASGDSMCLWLNTGTGRYSLRSEASEKSAHRLRWKAGGEEAVLSGGAASRPFLAATRPGCPDGPAELSVERTSSAGASGVVTLLVVPE